MTGTLHEDIYMLIVVSLSVLLRVRNGSDRSCAEYQNKRFMFNNFFFICSESRAVYKIMWGKNMVQPDRPHMTM